MAVPRAASRLVERCLAMGVLLGGLPPAARHRPARAGRCERVDALRRLGPQCPWATKDGLCGRLDVVYTYHLASGGNREGGTLTGPSRTGPPPVGRPGRTPQRAFVPPRLCAPVLPWGT